MPDAVNFDKATQAWSLQWDPDWVTAVTFVGASRKIVAGNNLGQLLVWELPEKPTDPAPKPIAQLEGHSNVISKLVSTADGKAVLSSSYDHSIRVWDLEKIPSPSKSIIMNARTIEESKRRSGAKVPAPIEMKVAPITEAKILKHHSEWICSMSLSKDEKWIVSGDDSGTVILWDRIANQEVRRWKGKGWIYTVSLSPDNKQALVSERLPLVFDSGRHVGCRLWDATTGQPQKDLMPDLKGLVISNSAYSPDGKLLALGRGGEVDGTNGKVVILDPKDGKKLRELTPGHLSGLTDLVFHPDGKHLATSGRDTLIRIWDTTTGKMVKELGKGRGGQFKDWICAIAFSADGKWLIGGDMIGAIQVWYLG